jgi:cytochrome c oxidase assembly protein subunit 15
MPFQLARRTAEHTYNQPVADLSFIGMTCFGSAEMKNKSLVIWLFLCCTLVFAMATIGAVTRLTESGLSITEWHPVSGALPPLNAAQWQHEFDLYKRSPEFQAKHFWMSLSDFKHIFFWEWLHRLVGRSVGIAFAVPLLYFWRAKRIPRGYGPRLLLILGLGFLQGFVGWFMVESGLVNRPSVSHFRLATHLCLALVIYSAMFWTALDLLSSPDHQLSRENRKWIKIHGLLALLLLATTIVWGAFTAGLHAGLEYNTFPGMDGHWMPDEPFSLRALATIPGWVQFTHRYLAQTTGLVILLYAVRLRNWPLGLMVLVQIGLGISTLLSQVWMPLAAIHQAGAIVLLSLLLVSLQRECGRPSDELHLISDVSL